jgi:hypothetical protein
MSARFTTREGCSFYNNLTGCRQASEGSLVDMARTEAGDSELVRMIERCFRKGEVDPEELEELWKASVRAYTARRREEMRAAWQEYHQGQAACHRTVLESLVSHHEAEAERYRDRLTKEGTA